MAHGLLQDWRGEGVVDQDGDLCGLRADIVKV